MAKPKNAVLNAVIRFLAERKDDASVAEIKAGVAADLGGVAPSSVRSALNNRSLFERTARARYRLHPEPNVAS
jgi:hypothetical protein